MEPGDLLAIFSRWVHIFGVIILVGGTLFLRFVVLGAGLAEEQRNAMRKPWGIMVGAAAVFLLASGLYNAAIKAIGFELTPIYLALLGLKIFLGLFLFWLSAVLTGKSERARKFREREKFWLNIATTGLVVIVLAAGFMKMDSAGYAKKVKQDQNPAVESE